MNHDEMIDVIQACKDGAEIECKGKYVDDTTWDLVIGKPLWNFDRYDYRIKPQLKKIDMSICIESGVDCEFSQYTDIWRVGKLARDLDEGRYTNNTCDEYLQCRVRQDHWHSGLQKEKCPLPDGLRVQIEELVYYENYADLEDQEIITGDPNNILLWRNVIRFKIISTAIGWEY